jgi:Fe-S cluster assembly protein SufD
VNAVPKSFVAEWERAARRRQLPELERVRDDAWQRFLSIGFPTIRDEEWRFTNVAAIAEGGFTLAPPALSPVAAADLAPLRLRGAAAELVFVNGRFAPALSRRGGLPDGGRVESLAASLEVRGHEIEPYVAQVAPLERHPFVALNTAFIDEGACVELGPGTVVSGAIHLLFIATDAGSRATMTHPRIVVALGARARATLVETYAGAGDHRYFTNAVTQVSLGEEAVLDHYKLQYESVGAYHVGAIHVDAGRGAVCASHSISVGGALVRNDVVAVLNGEGVECSLNGLYLADGQRLVDHHTTIDHARPHCGSREIYNGILADRARGVFNGKIIVRPDAQQTDAKQTNRALLLSEDALINTKPQLEIFANDVKCTHGAAVGQLDDEALFYLRSRGLSDAAARRMLIQAFAANVLNLLPLEAVRAGVEARLHQQLERVLPAAA